jgi:hypothetical protein
MSDLIPHEPSQLAPSEAPAASTMDLIAAVLRDQSITTGKVEIIERLTALMEREREQQRKEAFDAALLRVQIAVPRIKQNGMMDRGPGKGQIHYAKREDIDLMVRPIYQAEGFSVTWDAHLTPDGSKIDVTGTFSCAGHTVVKHWPCSPDASGGKTGPQAVSSTIAYGKRQISKMVWDIIEEGEDQNGADVAKSQPITQDQADDIRTRMNDLPQQEPGRLLAKLCAKYGVKRPEEIRTGDLVAAMADVAATEKVKR